MKKTVLILLSLIITLSVFAQNEEANTDEMKKELQNQKDDTTSIRFKKKTVQIVEDDDETQIFVKKHRKNDDDWDWMWDDNDGFTGSWSGFSMGLSNFVDKDFSLSRVSGEEFLDLNTGKSWNMNLNFAQYSINFIGDKFGLVTGLGLEWNYYRFDNKNSVQQDPTNGEIIIRDLAVEKPSWDILESKLSTTYATLPILLEIHSSSSQSSGVVFAAGAIGGLKLGSNTKIVYKENDNKNKERTRDDFNLAPFRYGVHARLGVGDWLIYGTYYFTSIFEKDKGPELYPISIGFALSFE